MFRKSLSSECYKPIKTIRYYVQPGKSLIYRKSIKNQIRGLTILSQPYFQLNLLPVTLSADQFSIGLLPFESPDQLRQLRSEHSATHIIQRYENALACIPLVPEALQIGAPHTINVGDAPHLVRKLLQGALLRLFKRLGYTFTSFDPPSFIRRNPSRDMLAQALGKGNAAKAQQAHVYPRYLFASKILQPFAGPPLFGIQIDISTRYELDCSIASLMSLGFDPTGFYVRAKRQKTQPIDPSQDPNLDLRLAGRVRQVVNDLLLLEDAPEFTELQANQARLESSPENIEAYLRLSGISDVNAIIARLKSIIFSVIGAPGRLEHLDKQAAWLQKRGQIPLAVGLSCTVGKPLLPSSGGDTIPYRCFLPPEFIFNPAGSKVHSSSIRGLDEFGPFDNESFGKKRLNIAVVTPTAYQGDVEVFLRKFVDGTPKAAGFTRGFVRQYLLYGCKFAFATFEPEFSEASSYRKACLRVLQNEPKPDLAFVIIQERHKLLQGDDDPYLVSKSIFMSQGVPVQEIEIETIRVAPVLERSIPFKLNNIGLACYAKLGGIPFVMAAIHGLAHELIIGIGSAKIRNGRLSGEERIVGITTVFSADGNYLLHNCSHEVDYNDYPEELLKTLRDVIEQIQHRNAWQPGDTIRLIFHVFKPLKNVEAQAVKHLVEQLVDYKVEFAFLHVSEDHDWVLFDRNSMGISGKGTFVPERGYAIPLSRSEILLSVTGSRDLKTMLQSVPNPLLLCLHRESTFRDLEYLAGQVFRFTSLSWHSFLPSNKPVTILYSDRIATLLGKLRRVKNWNPDVLATSLRNSRWFL